MTSEKPEKKKLPPDARVVAALALLLEGASDEQFDGTLQALIESMKPRIRQAWSERKLKHEMYDPLTEAVRTGDVREMVKAIYTNEAAMKLLNKLQAEHCKAK